MFCGCSGSSLVACGLSLGYSISQIEEFGRLSAEATLGKKQGNQVWSYLYNSKWNRTLVDIIYGDICLKDIPKDIVIPSYLIDNQKNIK